MGGLIGHGIVKFTIAAGLLHAPVDVNLHRAESVIDPGIPVTLVSPDFATRLALKPRGQQAVSAYTLSGPLAMTGPVSISIHTARFKLSGLAIETPDLTEKAPKADIVFGRDMLLHATLALDLDHDTIGAVAGSDFRTATGRLQKIPVEIDPEGRIHLEMTIRGIVYPAIFDMSAASAATVGPGVMNRLATPGDTTTSDQGVMLDDAHIGDIALSGIRADKDQGQAYSAGIVLGLAAFKGHRMVLDLEHELIWLR
ncbi:hypothetical protein [Sphingomonas sp. MMS24-J13]|uniref:hypothetical protein n=1 Tax=Sphingomonas sp. MMS24-J13 TaxID=3238686 RepID=UPI00384AF691